MKYDILEDGLKCCEQLCLDFDEVYKRTNTSYKPYPSGNSDYKSASSVERIEAFIKLGRPDPIQYEDENGPISWERAKYHVEKVLTDFKK
jgi:7-cyano-7-deazaguanine synthase